MDRGSAGRDAHHGAAAVARSRQRPTACARRARRAGAGRSRALAGALRRRAHVEPGAGPGQRTVAGHRGACRSAGCDRARRRGRRHRRASLRARMVRRLLAGGGGHRRAHRSTGVARHHGGRHRHGGRRAGRRRTGHQRRHAAAQRAATAPRHHQCLAGQHRSHGVEREQHVCRRPAGGLRQPGRAGSAGRLARHGADSQLLRARRGRRAVP